MAEPASLYQLDIDLYRIAESYERNKRMSQERYASVDKNEFERRMNKVIGNLEEKLKYAKAYKLSTTYYSQAGDLIINKN